VRRNIVCAKLPKFGMLIANCISIPSVHQILYSEFACSHEEYIREEANLLAITASFSNLRPDFRTAVNPLLKRLQHFSPQTHTMPGCYTATSSLISSNSRRDAGISTEAVITCICCCSIASRLSSEMPVSVISTSILLRRAKRAR